MFFTQEGITANVVGLLGAACDGGTGKEGIEAYFQDLELAPLGSPSEEYRQYISDIEKEYEKMPLHMYRSLRLKVCIIFIFTYFNVKDWKEESTGRTTRKMARLYTESDFTLFLRVQF